MVMLVTVGSRTQRTLDKQLGVGRPVDDVDVLVVELMHDTVDTAAAHTDACTYRIDTVVIALDCHLGTLSGHARDLLDGNQTVGDLGNLLFQQTLQEGRAGTGENDLRIVVLVVDTLDDGTHGLALTIHVTGDLLALGQDEFVVVIVDEEHLALPHLIDLSGHDLTDLVLVFVVKLIVLQLQHLAGQCLTQREDGTATELSEVDRLGHFLADLVVGLNLARVGEADLLVLVSHLTVGDYHTVAVNFKVTLVGVDDDVKVLVAAVDLCQHVAEAFLQHAHERGAVDVLGIFKLPEGVDHRHLLVVFLSCYHISFSLLFSRCKNLHHDLSHTQAWSLFEVDEVFGIFHLIHVEVVVHVHLHGTFLAFNFHLFVDSDHEVSSVDTLEDAAYLLSVSLEHFHGLAHKVVVLLFHLERLTETCRSHFELIVLVVAAEMVLDILAQLCAVFDPHAVGMVNFNSNLVIGRNIDIHQEVVFVLQPLIH